jgi:hypothetical protein
MLVNALLFNNEVHLLIERLSYEYQYYDKFLIYEATTLFSGARKPLYLEKYKNLIPDPDNKIEFRIINDLSLPIDGNFIGTNNLQHNQNRWIVEADFRNRALHDLGQFPQSAILVFQDIDEIASIESLETAVKGLENGVFDIYRFSYHWFKHGVLENDLISSGWFMGFACPSSVFKSSLLTPHNLRIAKKKPTVNKWITWDVIGPGSLRNADTSIIYPELDISFVSSHEEGLSDHSGWHLSSMHGRNSRIHALKSNSFSHAEFSDPDNFKDFNLDPYEILLRLDNVDGQSFPGVSPKAPSFIKKSPNFKMFA